MIAYLLAASLVPQPAELKLFKDWIVGCDNGRSCHAVSLGVEPEPGRFEVSIKRGPEPDAEPEVLIRNASEGVSGLAIDGKPLGLVLRAENEAWPIEGEGRRYWLDAAMAGRELQYLGKDGVVVDSSSLAGLNAALLYMDEQQKRLGTMSALVRKGGEPSFKVPPPPALPVIPAVPGSSEPPSRIAKAEVDRLRQQMCDAEVAADLQEEDAEVYRLDAYHTLAIVPLRCQSGAYNLASLLLVNWEEGRWTPVRFDTDSYVPGEQPPGIAYNAEWNAESRLLGTGMRGRGIGDCGIAQAYVWDGARFRLVEQAEMSECRGSVDYIVTWRAETRTLGR